MDKQEQEFFEFFNKVDDVATKNGVSVYEVVNFRQIFDYAYAMGKADGATDVLASFKESN